MAVSLTRRRGGAEESAVFLEGGRFRAFRLLAGNGVGMAMSDHGTMEEAEREKPSVSNLRGAMRKEPAESRLQPGLAAPLSDLPYKTPRLSLISSNIIPGIS